MRTVYDDRRDFGRIMKKVNISLRIGQIISKV